MWVGGGVGWCKQTIKSIKLSASGGELFPRAIKSSAWIQMVMRLWGTLSCCWRSSFKNKRLFLSGSFSWQYHRTWDVLGCWLCICSHSHLPDSAPVSPLLPCAAWERSWELPPGNLSPGSGPSPSQRQPASPVVPSGESASQNKWHWEKAA